MRERKTKGFGSHTNDSREETGAERETHRQTENQSESGKSRGGEEVGIFCFCTFLNFSIRNRASGGREGLSGWEDGKGERGMSPRAETACHEMRRDKQKIRRDENEMRQHNSTRAMD